MKKSTLINNRVNKQANMTGPQQALVPGSSHAKGKKGKAAGNGRGKNTAE